MRKYLILILIFLIPIVYATDECMRSMELPTDVPCNIISSFHPREITSGSVCSDYNLTIIDDANQTLQNHTWNDYFPVCFVPFNITEPGTYLWNSSLETGVIVLKRENNMLAIVIGSLIIMAFFIALGIVNKGLKLKLFSYGIALIELITMAGMLYAREASIDVEPILRVNFLIMLFLGFGVGMISMALHSFRMVNLGDNTVNEEPDKWEKNKW